MEPLCSPQSRRSGKSIEVFCKLASSARCSLPTDGGGLRISRWFIAIVAGAILHFEGFCFLLSDLHIGSGAPLRRNGHRAH